MMETNIFLNDDNRTALWNALRWSETFVKFSPKYITKQKWFMETVDKFYFTYFGGITLPFNKSREELVSINKEAIRFLINDIKLYKDMVIQENVVDPESLSIDAVELTDESFGRNYDIMGKCGRNADDINNKFSERQKEYEIMNKPFVPTNPPIFSMQETTEIGGNFDIRNGEETSSDINTKFAERQKEYEKMNKPITPSNQSIFNISEIEMNELNVGFDMRDEEEIIGNTNQRGEFYIAQTPENIKHVDGIIANTNNIMDIIHKIEMKQDSIIEMIKDFKTQMKSYEKNLSIYEELVSSIPTLLSNVNNPACLLENIADFSKRTQTITN